MESEERELSWSDLKSKEQDELSVVLRFDHLHALIEGRASVIAAVRIIHEEQIAAEKTLAVGVSALVDRWYNAFHDMDIIEDALLRHGKPTADGEQTVSSNVVEPMRKESRPKVWRNGIRSAMCVIAIRERIGGGRLLMERQGISDCLLPDGKPLAVLRVLDRLDDNVVEPAETQTARRIRLAVEAAQRFTAPDALGREHFKSERPGRKGRGIPKTLRRAVGNQVAREEGLEKAPSGRTVERWLHNGSYNLPFDLRFPVKG